ncbi:hypothetical protein EGT07_32430, partial [Herbaspirillum sp. HC18]
MLHATKALLGTLTLAAGLLSALGAQAQQMQHGPGMMGPGMMGCPMMGGQGMTTGQIPLGYGQMGSGMMMTGPAIEGRLAYLKAELGISDAQANAWNGYVAAVRARMTGMQGIHQAMMQAW